jgi:hypothetical protein
MTTPDSPAAVPLDAERARLRSAGYTDTEISQILIAREMAGSQQPAGATGQGVMSSVLSSLVAVASYARSIVPSFRKDAATMLDRAAPASARAGATASLMVKIIVVGVLAYAAWQEWQQHIIYATETAAAQAEEIKIEVRAMKINGLDAVPLSNECRRQDSRAKGGTGYPYSQIPNGANPNLEPQGGWPCP